MFYGTYRPSCPTSCSAASRGRYCGRCGWSTPTTRSAAALTSWSVGWPEFVCSPPPLSASLTSGAVVGVGVSAKGDFNGDGFGDLAIGAPGEDRSTGAVGLCFTAPRRGCSRETRSTGRRRLRGSGAASRAPEPIDNFGAGGRPGISMATAAQTWRSARLVRISTAGWPISSRQSRRPDRRGGYLVARTSGKGEAFGASLAAGDFGKTSHSDLAVGQPGYDEGVGSVGCSTARRPARGREREAMEAGPWRVRQPKAR